MTHMTFHQAARAMAAAAAVLVGTTAWGQMPASQGGGRARDANQQVGSGGINRPAEQIDFAARNALITGNVAGGREFRGDVGYSAPTEFRGSLGSDDFFRFNAQSLGSSLPVVQSGIRGSFGPGDFVTVPRTTGSAVIYTPIESTFAQQPLMGPSGGSFNVGSLASGAARITLDQPSFAVTQQPDGRMLELQASPLLGMREIERARVTPRETLEDQSQRERFRLDTEIRSEEPTDLARPMDTRPLDQQQLDRRPITTMVDPGLTLGQQMSAFRLGTDTRTFDQQVADIESSMFRQLGSRNANPGDDVYLDVLRAMRGDGPPKAATKDPSAALPELEAPTIEELEKAEQDRRKALEARAAAMEAQRQLQDEIDKRAAPGTPGTTEPGTTPQPGVEDGPDLGDPATMGGTGQLPDSLIGLLDTLNTAQDLPRLTTLAGERDDRVNRLMRDAEADLAAERFFDAENKYRQVLTDAPESPMAMAGQVHAQLGAAMIKSAAYNLRKLFEKHPELIGVRYDAKLLPPQKRLDFVHNQIMQELREAPRPETALALAYLGYQINSRQLVRYGLAIAEARAPQDPLLPLLRRLWLDEAGDGDRSRKEPNK